MPPCYPLDARSAILVVHQALQKGSSLPGVFPLLVVFLNAYVKQFLNIINCAARPWHFVTASAGAQPLVRKEERR